MKCKYLPPRLGFQTNILIAYCSGIIYRCQEGTLNWKLYVLLVSHCDLHSSKYISMVWPESVIHDRGGTE